jgi:hypothetical protein
VEAWLNGRLLTRAAHNASTQAIIVGPIAITATVPSDDSVTLTWTSQNTTGLAPDKYKIFVDGSPKNFLSPTNLPFRPRQY